MQGLELVLIAAVSVNVTTEPSYFREIDAAPLAKWFKRSSSTIQCDIPVRQETTALYSKLYFDIVFLLFTKTSQHFQVSNKTVTTSIVQQQKEHIL